MIWWINTTLFCDTIGKPSDHGSVFDLGRALELLIENLFRISYDSSI